EGDLELRGDQTQLWHSRTVASNPVCRRCRYALHCGGGCAILALNQNGAFNSNYCDGFANRFRASVAEAYLEHVSGAGPVKVQERVCDL
ncbi:MAG TPA: radical SAM protein, partial [Thermoanaerobaculia bacterium]|nr:radical SAM protein [Thermoanaerobaculia bacterium]